MKLNFFILFIGLSISSATMAFGSDTTKQHTVYEASLFEIPQNTHETGFIPGTNQALTWSKSMYTISYTGIDRLSDWILPAKSGKGRKIINGALQYALGLGFAKYGSELPIPLGIWAHEEFHRNALLAAGFRSENGNSILSRWDGTVYGLSDEDLSDLKSDHGNQLLHAYVSGVQYHTLLNKDLIIDQFYDKNRVINPSLMLYNAWYVHNYFRFSTSAASDSVKVIAPKHESKDPSLRDFAGSDLTAWAYDMHVPDEEFGQRDDFPDGEGENRRVGFSDLSPEAQAFLKNQKRLSLINFLNPVLFYVRQIRLSQDFSFTILPQYNPTYFGHDLAVFIPMKVRNKHIVAGLHQNQSFNQRGYGVEVGMHDLHIAKGLSGQVQLEYWNQPLSFYSNEKIQGGLVNGKLNYQFSNKFGAYFAASYKSAGWSIQSAYLSENLGMHAGISLSI